MANNLNLIVQLQPHIQEIVLSNLIMGSYMSRTETIDISNLIGLEISGRKFICTIIKPINLTQSIALKNHMNRYQLMQWIGTQLGEFCRANGSPDFQLISASIHQELIILASITAVRSKELELRRIRSYLSVVLEWINQCEKLTGVRLRAMTSPAQTGIENIHVAYTQAKELESYIIMLSLSDRCIGYDDVVKNGWDVYNKEHLIATNQWESAFLNALERNDFHKLQALLHKMAAYEFQIDHITIQSSTATLYTLLNKVRIVIDCMRPFAGPDVLEVFETAPKVLYRKSVAEIMEDVDMIFSNFFDSLEEHETSRTPVWLTRMDDYIMQKYDDPELNVSTISQHFGLNAAYAGRLYKSYYGFSVLDRINHIRIKRAVELLQDNMRLKDVAEIIGYENRKRMNRAFLKYVGYTPKEAKEGKNLDERLHD